MKSSLSPGTKLGRYEIISPLGSGGMGEVYLARDSGLDRKVALKILPENVASNPQRMQRFVLEAKAASALNHPNILTIHEIGTEPGKHFIAVEFIEGETLRRRMVHEPLTLAEAIDIASQLASALSTAHAAGIIHRDIKPENIMVRRDGIVKVLDFGLAKLTERWRADEVDPDAATRANIQTEPGVVLGTTAYMSPEQTRAFDVDPRTDIWSLGVVLYEMITGCSPFKSDTASDTSAAILKTEPPALTEYAPDIPFELERIVRKALQKDREERYQVIKDLQLDLKSLKRDLDLGVSVERSLSSRPQPAIATGQTTQGSAASVATQDATLAEFRSAANRRGLLLAAIIVIPVLLIAGWLWWRRSDAPTIRPSSWNITQLTSRKKELGESAANHARFSPDGKFVVYASTKDGQSGIWLKQVESGEPFSNRSEPGIVTSPIWSPDGKSVAYLSNRDSRYGIWTMPAFGGPPSLIKQLDAFSNELIAWSNDGQIYFVSRGNLHKLDVKSQQISQVTNFDASKPLDRTFCLSHDNERIAYTDVADGQIDVWVMPKQGGQPRRVTNDAYEDGKLVWTADGRNILYSSKRNGILQIFFAHLDGRSPEQLTVNDNDSEVLDVSPDGARILYATGRDELDLWSVKLDRPREVQITSDIGIEFWPAVAPDGTAIAFQATPMSKGATLFNSLLLAKSLTGGDSQRQLVSDGFAPRWSPDGKQIAFLRHANGAINLWRVHAGGGDASPLTADGITFGGFVLLPYNRSQTQDFQWSADSSQLVYCASTSSIANVWQTAANGSGAKQLSHNAARNIFFFDPFWSPDGKSVAWLALATDRAGPKNIGWSVWLSNGGTDRKILESDSVLGLLGWSQSGRDLIVKTIPQKNVPAAVPANVNLFAIGLDGTAQRPIAELRATYFQNIQLSPAKDQIAYVSRSEGTDSLEVVSATGGGRRTIMTSNDPRVYFSSLVWSPDSRTIYYGKQAQWTVLSMIDNFK